MQVKNTSYKNTFTNLAIETLKILYFVRKCCIKSLENTLFKILSKILGKSEYFFFIRLE